MRKRSLRLTLFLSLLALAALAALLAFPARSYLEAAKATVVAGIEKALQNNLTIEVGSSRISLKNGVGLSLHDLVVREKEGERREIFTAQSFFVGLDVPSLIRGRIRVLGLSAFRPRVIVTRDAKGKLNVQGLFSPRYARENLTHDLSAPSLAETFGPLLWRDQVSFEEGELLYRDASRPAAEVVWLRHLELDVQNHLESDRLSVELAGSLEEPVHTGDFSLAGEIRGWRQARGIGDLVAAVTLRFREIDLQGLGAHLPGWHGEDRLAGRLEGQLSYEGSLMLPGKGRVELGVDGPFFESGRVHTRPWQPSRLGLTVLLDARRDRLSLSEGELQLGNLRIL